MSGLAESINETTQGWIEVCALADIDPNTGVAALVNGKQIAVFNTSEGLFALSNHDPFSGANVLSRGILGDIDGKKVVASPVYKQHFCLETGVCLEDEDVSVSVWHVDLKDGFVFIKPGKHE